MFVTLKSKVVGSNDLAQFMLVNLTTLLPRYLIKTPLVSYWSNYHNLSMYNVYVLILIKTQFSCYFADAQKAHC
jgi:hypothetical protein